jgi:hypothetical protein
MVDLAKLELVLEGAEVPPTIRDACRALLAAWRVDVMEPPGVESAVLPGTYALVEVRA